MSDLFNNWIYKKNEDNSARFVLGERGENPLVCIGVNPSTAEPGNLDPTLRQVKNRSIAMGFDGWIMLNLYPQRATDPNDLHCICFEDWIHCNVSTWCRVFEEYYWSTIWAAWGTLITKRPYLKDCLSLCVKNMGYVSSDTAWITIGKRSNAGHPHHPLYLPKIAKPEPFDIKEYLNHLK